MVQASTWKAREELAAQALLSPVTAAAGRVHLGKAAQAAMQAFQSQAPVAATSRLPAWMLPDGAAASAPAKE